MAQDAENTQRNTEICGKAHDVTGANGDDVIDGPAQRYLRVDAYPFAKFA